MRIGVVNTLHMRPELERLTCRRIRLAAERSRHHEIVLAAAASRPADLKTAQSEGWQTVRVPNRPLARKHNAALALCRDARCDAVVIVGSDNWLCDHFFDAVAGRLERGAEWFGLFDVYAICSYDPRALYFGGYDRPGHPRRGDSLGVGRAFSRTVLDKLGWQLWESGVDRGLDSSMQRLMRRKKLSPRKDFAKMADAGVTVLGIKTAVNITPFEALGRQRTTVEVDRAELLGAFPRDEVEALLASFEGAEPHAELSRNRRLQRQRKKVRERVGPIPDGTCYHLGGRGLCSRCLPTSHVPCPHLSGEGVCLACLRRGLPGA